MGELSSSDNGLVVLKYEEVGVKNVLPGAIESKKRGNGNGDGNRDEKIFLFTITSLVTDRPLSGEKKYVCCRLRRRQSVACSLFREGGRRTWLLLIMNLPLFPSGGTD